MARHRHDAFGLKSCAMPMAQDHLGNAVMRYIGLIVAFICIFIGVIWVAFDARKPAGTT